jgi:hypothetical protein
MENIDIGKGTSAGIMDGKAVADFRVRFTFGVALRLCPKRPPPAATNGGVRA